MEEFELEPGEQVIRSVRKHWFVFFASLLPFLLLAYVPVLIPKVAAWLSSVNPTSPLPIKDLSLDAPLMRLFTGLWWLILWIGAFNTFTQYFLNVWVITSQRIVDIHQYGFFDRQVSSFLLARVQDVTTSVDGFFADILGYGCVRVETAGNESKHFAMDGIRDPQAMRDLIMREIAALHPAGNASGV